MIMNIYAKNGDKSVIEAATELLDAMETCHICHSYLILPKFPVHCEDCSSDCENHDGDECTPIYVLHAKLRKLLKLATPASTARTDGLKQLRDDGWMVAVHNDYRVNGKFHTFWLLTRVGREGQFVKGEGETDEDALAQIVRQLASHAAPGSVPTLAFQFKEELDAKLHKALNPGVPQEESQK